MLSIVILDQQISMLLRRDLLFAFQEFAISLANSCNISSKVVSTPIRVSIYYSIALQIIFFSAFMFKNNIFPFVAYITNILFLN